MNAACPECAADIYLPEKTVVGEIVDCPECGVELEVVRLNPEVVLELAPEEQEDWGE